MASLIEILEQDLSKAAEARDDLDGQRKTLEHDATEAGSYDGVRDQLATLDDQITAYDRKISGLNRDLTREQARRDRVRVEPVSVSEAEADDADRAAAGSRSPRLARISDAFLTAQAWLDYKKSVAPNGEFSKKSRVDGPAIGIEGSILTPRRGLITGGSATSAGAFIVNDDTGIFDEGTFVRELTVLDLISRGTTESDVVEYVRQTGFTNNAATVPEADNVDPSDNTGRKPWSALTYERVVETVATIAHGEAASLRALSDAGQMRALLDNALRYGIQEELEDQIFNGDNAGDNFDGITHVSGTIAQIPAIDIATTIRKAKTKVRFQGKARANGVALNPLDWETLDLWLTFEGGGSNYRQASQSSAPTIWGLTVIETEAVAEGTAIVGDFRKAMLWDREQTTVRATQGYEDFFMKNLVAILAEMRAAFGVIRPKAFAICDISDFAS